MNEKLKDKNTDYLMKAILELEDVNECYNFFQDICTINEIKSLTQRLQVAKMLVEDKRYTEVEEVTGASTATISRVNRCLNYGEGGYKSILKKLGVNVNVNNH